MVGFFDARDFPPARVAEAKRGRSVSVCIPARNEESTIANVVGVVIDDLASTGIVDEVVVIDDSSTDATAAVAGAAGAVVWDAAAILPGHPGGPGKGEAMWRGLHVTTGDLVVFCDADVRSFEAAFVLGLVGPLLERPDLSFVKAHYRRPLDGLPGEGGRVTELMARPLVATLFPHLSRVIQPLAGECAARREVLETVPFAGGYAVDLGLLVDVSARWGAASIGQCDLGQRIHRNRPLADLGPQALAILQLGLERAGIDPRPLPVASAPGPARSVASRAAVRSWAAILDRPDTPDVEVTLATLPPLQLVNFAGATRRP